MLEKYYVLNSNILFKINMENNRFYIYDVNSAEWILDSSIMDKYYDAAYDVIEITESDAKDLIESFKGSVKKL